MNNSDNRSFAVSAGEHNANDSNFRAAVVGGLLLQIPLVVLCALMLDGGVKLRAALIALAAQWVVSLVIWSRRSGAPTRADLLFIRWGYLPLLVATLLGAMLLTPQ